MKSIFLSSENDFTKKKIILTFFTSSLSAVESGGDKSKATQPGRFLQTLAHFCRVLVPLSTGHFPNCQLGPRHCPLPINLNLPGATKKMRQINVNFQFSLTLG